MTTQATKAIHKLNAGDLEILSVTVYTDRAEVKRNVKAKLESGMNEVVVENISSTVNENSIVVNGRGDAVIHEVQVTNVSVLPDESSPPRLQELKNELKKLEDEQEALINRRKVIGKRYELLDTFVAKAGEPLAHVNDGQPVAFSDNVCEYIAKLMNYHETEHTNILEQSRQMEQELHKINEEIAKLREQMKHTGRDTKHTRNIRIMLESVKGGELDLDVSYQLPHASWRPAYEMRVQSTARTLKLTYYGTVSQSTGEDWMDTPLILSTAQPSLGGVAPRLGTLSAEICKPPPAPQWTPRTQPSASLFGSAGYQTSAMKKTCDVRFGFSAPPPPPPEITHAPVAVANSGMSTMFMIAHRANIPSDSTDHRVVIAVLDLDPKIFYETVPSKSTNVYLTAFVVNESALPLLAGEASIYVDSSFIGKNHIKAVSPGERFKCSLGVDPAIKVEYKPVHKYSEQVGLITRSVSTMNEQKILIKNTRSSSIVIIVREHVLGSTDEKIKIKLYLPELDNKDTDIVRRSDAEPAIGARLDANHNLEWVKRIEPNKEEELIVKWSVEHLSTDKISIREEFSHGTLN